MNATAALSHLMRCIAERGEASRIQSGTDGWSWVSGCERPDAGESMRGQARPPMVWGWGRDLPVASYAGQSGVSRGAGPFRRGCRLRHITAPLLHTLSMYSLWRVLPRWCHNPSCFA